MDLASWTTAAERNGWRVTRAGRDGVYLQCPGCGATASGQATSPVPPPCGSEHSPSASDGVADYDDLVEQLTRRRHAIGLSQQQLELAAGIPDGHLAKLESKNTVASWHRRATMPTIILWAQALGYSLTLTPAPLPPATTREIAHSSRHKTSQWLRHHQKQAGNPHPPQGARMASSGGA